MNGMMLSIGQIQADIIVVSKLLAEIESGNTNKHLKGNAAQLTQYAKSLGIQLIIPEYILNNLVLLTSWEARGRYDVHLVVRIDRLRHCYDVVEKWYKELYEKGFR